MMNWISSEIRLGKFHVTTHLAIRIVSFIFSDGPTFYEKDLLKYLWLYFFKTAKVLLDVYM